MNIAKKILSVVMVMILVFTVASMNGFADIDWLGFKASAETFTEGDYEYYVDDKGANISGYAGAGGDVVIPDSLGGYTVTGIGDYAFDYCEILKSVTIPDSVISIGYSAFYYCENLTIVVIGNGVTRIDANAFYCCYSLECVMFGINVTSIGEYAFYCTGLNSVVIPESVTSIGEHVFSGCRNLIGMDVVEGNECYSSDEFGVLFNKEKTELITYPAGNVRTEYIIPDSVTRIANEAFYSCASITNITIPDSVQSIGASAFYGTAYYNNDSNWTDGVLYIGSYLIKAKDHIVSGVYSIKAGTKTIADGTFFYCTNLESVIIPDSVTSIGDSAFEHCYNITDIEIPYSVISIGDSAFCDCTSLASVKIGDSVTSIGRGAFSGCTSLANVTIPDSVTSIGDYAFNNCTSLASVTIPDSVTRIGAEAFYNIAYYNNSSNWENGVLYIENHLISADSDISGTYSIKEGIKTVADRAFYGCSSLESVIIPDSVISIGDSAFSFCTSLANITIPDGVISIGASAFSACYSLANITIPDGVTSIGDSTFSVCGSLASITIPDSVTSIDGFAFYYCDSLTDVYYVGSKEQWDEITIGSFNECLLNATIHFNSSTPEEPTDSNFDYEITDGEVTITGYKGDDTDIEIPDTIEEYPVTAIGDSAFSYCRELESVGLPDGLTAIGNSAFSSCSELKSLDIPDSVTSIGLGAFYSCENLASVTIPEAVTRIEEGTFCFCYNLESINFSENSNLNFIGNDAFYGCVSLDSIAIPESVTLIGDKAFAGCSEIENVEISEKIESIGTGTFWGCRKLAFIDVDEANPYYSDIDGILFDKEQKILITYPKGKTAKSYTVPDGVVRICDYAFEGSGVGIENVIFPMSLTEIGEHIFDEYVWGKGDYLPPTYTLADIYYTGSEEQWNDIEINENNDCLLSATVHYDFVLEEEETTEPSTTEPTTEDPATEPSTTEPTTEEPATESSTTEPTTEDPATVPSTTEPTEEDPATEPATTEPTTEAPATEPSTTKPNTTKPVTQEKPEQPTKATKPAKVKFKSVKSPKKKRIVVTWNKVEDAKGYEVYCSTNKKFRAINTKKITIKKGNKVKATIKKLRSKKKYFVKVRAYKIVNGEKLYGKWSAVKTVKVR